MKRNVLISITTLLGVVFFVGCAQVISTNTTISDLVLMGVKTNSKVDITYEIVAKTKEVAEELLERKETPYEEIDEYGDTFRETITSKFTNDLSGDETTTWKKVEECIPRDDEDMDNDYKPFLNYEDPDWSKDDFEWYKKEDGTNISK